MAARPRQRFPDHFSSLAERYARFRPSYPEALFDHLAGLPRRRRRAWDCATGSAQAATELTRHFEQVVASDASLDQLVNPRVTAPRRAGILRLRSLAEASALADASVDLVTVAQALHWFDVEAFWAEVGRLLAPGGVVAVWCYQLLTVTPAVDRVVERYYREVVGPYWPPERRHVEAGYKDLPFPFDEQAWPRDEAIRRSPLEWSAADLLGYLGTWSASKRHRQATGREPLDEIRGALLEAWGSVRRRAVSFPLRGRIGRT